MKGNGRSFGYSIQTRTKLTLAYGEGKKILFQF